MFLFSDSAVIIFQYISIIVFGAIFGSFTTAVIHRAQNNQSYISKDKKAARSQCPSCGHQLRIRNLIPLLSWLFQKGRCEYCHVKISQFYPVIELMAISLALLFFSFLSFWHVIIALPVIPYFISFHYRFLSDKVFDKKLFFTMIILILLVFVGSIWVK